MWHLQMSHNCRVFTLVKIAMQFLLGLYCHDPTGLLASIREADNLPASMCCMHPTCSLHISQTTSGGESLEVHSHCKLLIITIKSASCGHSLY